MRIIYFYNKKEKKYEHVRNNIFSNITKTKILNENVILYK